MPTLLHIDSSSRGEASISRYLSHAFVQQWLQARPGGRVISRDLITSDLPVLSQDWVAAAFTPEPARTPGQAKAGFQAA